MQTGIGPGFTQDIENAASGFLGFQIQYDQHLFSFRSAFTGSIIGSNYFDIGILYGQVLTPLDSRFLGSMSLRAGLTSVSGSNLCIFGCGASDSSTSLALAVPVQASFQYRVFKFFWVGITGIGTFSKEYNYSGLMFSIHLGRFRN